MRDDLYESNDESIPPALHDLLREAGCDPACPIEEQRAALEALAAGLPERLQSLDSSLLHLRELETAGDGLPAVVGGLQRGKLAAYDQASTTWLGWWEDGQRGAVRCLRPRWRQDAVLHRRLERGVRLAAGIPGLAPMRFEPHGAWPHVAYRLSGLPLADLLPCEDPPDVQGLTRWLATALEVVATMHGRGLVFGPLDTWQVLLASHRCFLAWLDPIGGPALDPQRDLRQLATALLQLDPEAMHPLAQLAQPWIDTPPGSAAQAMITLQRALADHLVAARHRIVLRERSAGRDERAVRLMTATHRLQQALPPPPGRCCLRAGHDRVLYLIESDGRTVRGGAAAGVPPFGLMPLYSPAKGLDAAATRTLLRAWANRGDGDEALRHSAQERWEGSDEAGEAITRWLTAASRLRRARLVLSHRLRR